MHGHRCPLSVLGRPAICFKCEGVGHLRHRCLHWDRPRLRSSASAVQGPVVGKRGEGSVSKTPLQALNKPTVEEPSGSPRNQGDSSGPQEGLVAIPTGSPQDNQEDHGSPNEGVAPAGSTPDGKGLERTTVTEGDTEVSPMDIWGSFHLDEEGFLEVRHKKQRRTSQTRLSLHSLLNHHERTGEYDNTWNYIRTLDYDDGKSFPHDDLAYPRTVYLNLRSYSSGVLYFSSVFCFILCHNVLLPKFVSLHSIFYLPEFCSIRVPLGYC